MTMAWHGRLTNIFLAEKMLFTRRLIISIIFAAVLVALGSLYSIFFWLGLAANVAVLSIFLIDWANTPPPSRISVRRLCEEKLSLGARNVVGLRFRNRAGVPFPLEVRDEPPHLFDVSANSLSLELPADSDVTINYVVIPRRRGNYQVQAF
jgi:uncharacterized protein (DUF58 family)